LFKSNSRERESVKLHPKDKVMKERKKKVKEFLKTFKGKTNLLCFDSTKYLQVSSILLLEREN